MKKLTEMNRNELLSQATQFQRALDIRENLGKEHDRILKELKAERVRNRELAATLKEKKVDFNNYIEDSNMCDKELRAKIADLEKKCADEQENAHVWQTEYDNRSAEVLQLKPKIADLETANASLTSNNKQRFAENAKLVEQIKELKAELKAAGPVKRDGVFVKHDMVTVNEQIATYGGRTGEVVGNYISGHHIVHFEDDVSWQGFSAGMLRHAAPTCESCTSKQERIGELEHKVEVETDRANDLLMDRDQEIDLHANYRHAAQSEIEKLQSKNTGISQTFMSHQTTIATQQGQIADLSNRVALDSRSVIRLTRELSEALGGGE